MRLLGGYFEFGSPDAALDVGAIAKRTANRDLPRRTCGEIY